MGWNWQANNPFSNSTGIEIGPSDTVKRWFGWTPEQEAKQRLIDEDRAVREAAAQKIKEEAIKQSIWEAQRAKDSAMASEIIRNDIANSPYWETDGGYEAEQSEAYAKWGTPPTSDISQKK